MVALGCRVLGWAEAAASCSRFFWSNLGNRRGGVQVSDLGEDQFYRLPSRRDDVMVTVPLR
jgi:hypothetical protein